MKLVFCAHQLSVRIKRNLFQTFHTVSDQFLIHTTLCQNAFPGCRNLPKHFQQRIFRRITNALSFYDTGIVGQHRIIQQISVGLVGDIQLLWCIQTAIQINLLHRHFVLSKSSCLIRTDHRYAPKAFHCFQILDDGIFPGHFLCTEGLDDGHDGT